MIVETFVSIDVWKEWAERVNFPERDELQNFTAEEAFWGLQFTEIQNVLFLLYAANKLIATIL